MLSQNSSLKQNYYLMFQVITEWTLHAEQEEYTLEAIEWTHLVNSILKPFYKKNNLYYYSGRRVMGSWMMGSISYWH